MANILLTQRCIRSCPYCFAKQHMAESPPLDILPWEDLIYLTDLLQDSGEHSVSLLGGEPTLHPNFVDFVIYLLEREFQVTVFTSGVMSSKTLSSLVDCLGGIPGDKLGFVCNFNAPEKSPPKEVERVKEFMSLCGPQIAPGFNIYHTDFNLDFIFQYINQYGLRRSLRLGLAHPIPGAKNKFIQIGDIPIMIERLMSYFPIFEKMRVGPGLDCGFPLCAFTDTQVGWLYKLTNGHFRFGCGPAIDVGPDMSVWSCFPLSSYKKKSIYEFNSIQEVYRFYHEKLVNLRVEAGGIYEACDGCLHRESGVCAGGCAAHTLSAIQDEEYVRIQEVYP